MISKQFYLPCLAHASYLIGDEATGTAAVVDPQRDIDQYIAFAAEHSLNIKHVLLTHLHADFVAGHLELRDRVGATVYQVRRPMPPMHLLLFAMASLSSSDRYVWRRSRPRDTLQSQSRFSFTISTSPMPNRMPYSPETRCLSVM